MLIFKFLLACLWMKINWGQVGGQKLGALNSVCQEDEKCVSPKDCGSDGCIRGTLKCNNILKGGGSCIEPKRCCKMPNCSTEDNGENLMQPPIFKNCTNEEKCVRLTQCSEDDVILADEADDIDAGGSCDIFKGICCKITAKRPTILENCEDDEACVRYDHCGEDDLIIKENTRDLVAGGTCDTYKGLCCKIPGATAALADESFRQCSQDEGCVRYHHCEDDFISEEANYEIVKGGQCDAFKGICCKIPKLKNIDSTTTTAIPKLVTTTEESLNTCNETQRCIEAKFCLNGIIDVSLEGVTGIIMAKSITTKMEVCDNPNKTCCVEPPEEDEYDYDPGNVSGNPTESPMIKPVICDEEETCIDSELCEADGSNLKIERINTSSVRIDLGGECDGSLKRCCHLDPAVKACKTTHMCVSESLCSPDGTVKIAGEASTTRDKGHLKALGYCLLDTGLIGVCCKEAPKTLKCGQVSKEVVGKAGSLISDSSTYIGEFPWQAIIIHAKKKKVLGGAVIISDMFLLTTAPKVAEFFETPEELSIRVGEHNIRKRNRLHPSQDLSCAEIFINEKYNPSNQENGIAVIKLKKTMKMAMNVQPICLPDEHYRIYEPLKDLDDSFDHQECYATGFGIDPSSGLLNGEMKKAWIPILHHKYCEKLLREHPSLHPFYRLDRGFLCAGGIPGTGACTGDGGGPLSCWNHAQSRFEVTGLVSWDLGTCGQHYVPDGYINVYRFVNWIKKIMAKGD